MSQSDIDLLKRIKSGDQKSFTILYHRYSDLLFAYISHNLNKNDEIVSDIWQETWVIAVEKINNFHYKSTVFTWLCAIAKNKISDYYRQNKKQGQIQDIEKKYLDIDYEEIEVELIDSETKADVITILADLTDDYRYMLTAKYIENLSIEEIASAIGKTYKATESMLTRAREAFRIKFKQIENA
jgi:RNA polymerase sigma-70 factor (ECF subfamily)